MAALPFSGLVRFFGNTISEAAAFGMGFALGPVLKPPVRALESTVWRAYPDMPLDPGTAASIAAERVDDYPRMETEASYNGIDSTRFSDLYNDTLRAPGVGELLQLIRRKQIGADLFNHALNKAKLESQWDAPLANLQHTYLSPDILAVMLQRSVVPNQGQLPGVNLDTTGKVPRFPQVPIDAYLWAEYAGWSHEQLDAQTRIQGLPPGMDLVARMVYRGILDRGDFNLAAEQSNRRVEWADYEFEGYRQIPTARDYIDARIRNWITDAELYAGTARHGMSQADTDLLLKDFGRPMNARQVFRAERMGGSYGGPTDQIDPAFLKSLEESNVRPEWYNLEWAYRFSIPSYFVLRPLIQSGAITEERAIELFKWSGWPDDIAENAPKAFAASAGGTSTSFVSKAHTQLWTRTHTSYVNELSDDVVATNALTAIGVPAAEIPDVLSIWQVERSLVRKPLTPSQVRKAYQDAVPNPATGQPWTFTDAYDYLIQLGYSHDDATTFLGE